MQAKLVVVAGKASKGEVTLKLPTVVGRGRKVDLRVAHRTVSRRHCLIFERDGALVVRDNSSLNGTLVEGNRITEAVLKPGDRLTIGPLTFKAVYEHKGSFPTVGQIQPSSDGTPAAAAIIVEDPGAVVPPAAAAPGVELPQPLDLLLPEEEWIGENEQPGKQNGGETPLVVWETPLVEDQPPREAEALPPAEPEPAVADSLPVTPAGQGDEADFEYLGEMAADDEPQDADTAAASVPLVSPQEKPPPQKVLGDDDELKDFFESLGLN